MADVAGKKKTQTSEEFAGKRRTQSSDEFASRKKIQTNEDFVESVLSVRRVAKVIRGGRRFAFSALVVVGDRKGSIGVALGKSRDVSAAISKALKKARKHMISIPLYKKTV